MPNHRVTGRVYTSIAGSAIVHHVLPYRFFFFGIDCHQQLGRQKRLFPLPKHIYLTVEFAWGGGMSDDVAAYTQGVMGTHTHLTQLRAR